jgi:predicted Zn finger-like uncharacterized protein
MPGGDCGMVSNSLTKRRYPRGQPMCPDSPMLITCPKCATSYQVDSSSLSPAGQSVHCDRCRHTWFAANLAALAEVSRAYRIEIAAFSGALAAPLYGPESVENLERAAAIAPPVIDGFNRAPEAVQPEVARGWSYSEASGANEDGTRTIDGDEPPSMPKEPAEAAPRLPKQAPEDLVRADAVPVDTPEARTFPAQPRARTQNVGSAVHRVKRRARPYNLWILVGPGMLMPMLIAADLALIGWRADLVRLLPQTASLYAMIGLPVNLRGVKIANLTVTADTAGDIPVLVVEGTLANITPRQAVQLPKLRFSVRDHLGRELYGWVERPPKGSLAPGEALRFASRLPSPPARSKDVVVHFVNASDGNSSARE